MKVEDGFAGIILISASPAQALLMDVLHVQFAK